MNNGWQAYKMGDLLTQNFNGVKISPDKSYKLLGVRLEGRGAFLREEKTGDNISASILNPVRAGDFIYSRLFAWRGAFGVVPEQLDGCFVSGEFPTFTLKTEKLLPKFLQLFFARSVVWEEVEKYCTGTTKASRNRFKEQFFLGFEIPLPPLDEQRRIVERVEAVAARIAKAQSLREEADRETDALIESELNSIIRELEKNYETKYLEELLVEANYGTSVKCFPEREEDAIPVLRIPNVASEKITLSDLKFGILSKAEFDKTVLKQGDILVVRTNGSAELVGRCAVVPELPESMAFASYMIRIRCKQEVVSSDFLQLVLRQQRKSGFLFDFARTSAGQYNVSLGRLYKAKIPIPPLDEQRRIVAYLDSVQARLASLRELQSTAGEELSALLPSVLDKAFKGEL
jgi:type I restriction enzyme S subunit